VGLPANKHNRLLIIKVWWTDEREEEDRNGVTLRGIAGSGRKGY
jgi:hypothetical protein